MPRERLPNDLEWLGDAARRVEKHPATLRRWIALGYLKRHKKALDRRAYVSRSELDKLIDDPPVER